MIEKILSIDPLEWAGIFSAMLSGTIIGTERQILGKPVGIRTSMLICVGTYVFVAIANSVNSDATDPSRIIGQVVTGIGFLGAGVMLSRDGLIYGVTSAAAIWVLAAIGVTIGSHHYLTGIRLAVLAVIILVGVDMLEGTFKALQQGVHSKLKSKGKSDIPPPSE
jgi:putative Mg2+ transporter-C (MgtC) family protein